MNSIESQDLKLKCKLIIPPLYPLVIIEVATLFITLTIGLFLVPTGAIIYDELNTLTYGRNAFQLCAFLFTFYNFVLLLVFFIKCFCNCKRLSFQFLFIEFLSIIIIPVIAIFSLLPYMFY